MSHKPFISVAIIGCSESGKDEKTTQLLFAKMKEKALDIVKNEFKLDPKDISWTSGGCSFADHVAVSLFLDKESKYISLFLPCLFDNGKFYDNGVFSYVENPGKRLNQLHAKFSKQLAQDTIKQISSIEEQINKHPGVWFHQESPGFHARNRLVAECSQYMIAFTYGETEPVDGGTKHTWNLFKKDEKRRVHVNLDSLVIIN